MQISRETTLHRHARAVSTVHRQSRHGRLHILAAVKQRSAREICCSKTLVAKPEDIPAVQKYCEEVVQFSSARIKDKSYGIVAFDCVQDNWDRNVFHFWERYESSASLSRHHATPQVMQFLEQVQPLLEGPPGMALYEWRNGQIGHQCVLEGPKGEGGLDDATGASGAAGGAGMKQTSGTVDLTQISEEEDHVGQFERQVASLKNMFNNMFAAGKK